MKNVEYTKSVLMKNDIIIIDTSATMNYERFDKLVTQIGSLITKIDKKIIVPKAVWKELIRHQNSNINEKRIKAERAIDIISLHRNIFLLEDEIMDSNEIVKTFADVELLSTLTKNKIMHKQLLITNDKKLSTDAFKLNLQESCFGRKIEVCYITCSGTLNMCECAHVKKENINSPKVQKRIKMSNHSSNTHGKHRTKKIGVHLATFATGICIGKYHSQLLKFIKTAI